MKSITFFGKYYAFAEMGLREKEVFVRITESVYNLSCSWAWKGRAQIHLKAEIKAVSSPELVV